MRKSAATKLDLQGWMETERMRDEGSGRDGEAFGLAELIRRQILNANQQLGIITADADNSSFSALSLIV